MKNKPLRSEEEIFADLAALCVKPGYIHAIAYVCFRDNMILYTGQMTEADMEKMFSPSRLLRTEINTLIGLMVKAEIDWALPAPDILQGYITASEELLEELHRSMARAAFGSLTREAMTSGTVGPLRDGASLREPIFYGGESAYNFQYLELARRKYAADAAWLRERRGFTLADAHAVAIAVEQVQSDRSFENRERMRSLRTELQ